MFRLPADWEAESSGGYFPHLVYLVHPACGLRTGMAYDLGSNTGPLGASQARQLVYGHTCDET
jgi:hypothetical protein